MKFETKDIMKIMDHFSLSPLVEMSLRSGDTELKLTKASPEVVSTTRSQEEMLTAEEPPMMSSFPKKKDASSKPSSVPTEIISSPIVGTFYRSPAPDAPPFVLEGAKVATGNPIAVIEAMKVMNKLEAEFDMEIVRVIAENGVMAEYGTSLFEVQRL